MESRRKQRIALTILTTLVVVLAALVGLILTGVLRPATVPGAGEATLDYLRGTPYTQLVIEIDYVATAGPDSTSVNLLRARLAYYTDKATVTLSWDDSLSSGGASYTVDAIYAMERAHRDRQTGGDTAILYLLYLDGAFADPGVGNPENVLGIAYTSTSIAVFKDRIRDAATPGPIGITATDIENSVLVHEAGHILGLVNLVYTSDLAYEDPQHPGHSTDQSCVMYWAIEGAGIGGIFSQPPPTDFGSEARYDLAKLKAGGYTITPRRAPPLPVTFAADAQSRETSRFTMSRTPRVRSTSPLHSASMSPYFASTSPIT